MRALVILALALGAAACDEEVVDSDTDVVTDTGEEWVPCEETDLFIDGPEAPRVSDTWAVIMRCDGATLVGPMVLRITPVEMATVSENEITWVQPGEGEIRVQVGTYVERKDVVVLE